MSMALVRIDSEPAVVDQMRALIEGKAAPNLTQIGGRKIRALDASLNRKVSNSQRSSKAGNHKESKR